METGHLLTIKRKVKKTNSNIVLKKTNDIRLSIQFSLDGFSFYIQDNITKEALFFSEYLFEEKQVSPEEVLKIITSIFTSDLNLQNEFSSVLVIHQNELYTLVPQKYFDEQQLSNYLNFNIKTLKTDFIAFDNIEINNSNNVYVPYININNYLFQNFGEFTYKHHISVLIEKLISKNNNEALQFYVNVSFSTFDVIVLDGKKLEFANSFSYHSKEDFIYYILFVFEQLKLDTEKVPLYFMGKISLESEIYKITFEYIRNVFFKESKNTIFKNLNLSTHDNYILLGS